MFSKFELKEIPLSTIMLDVDNPRIVTQKKLKSQDEILKYLFDHEDLARFVKKISVEGHNPAAERPYVVKKAKSYVVVEGNTRIAAYKVLVGILKAPAGYESAVPTISSQLKETLEKVVCSVSPTRDLLLPIMASAHFGLGDKSKWGYLGSRKAVFDEYKAGKSLQKLSTAFDKTKSQVADYIIEYLLYLEALKLSWTSQEKEVLLDPAVEFNPPVRFLQTLGHKAKLGVSYDKTNLTIQFDGKESQNKYKHLVKRLVITPEAGLGATAGYDDVFKDYAGSSVAAKPNSPTPTSVQKSSATSGSSTAASATAAKANPVQAASMSKKAASGAAVVALFSYEPTITHGLFTQLMREAREINVKKFPAAATFLLRNIVETILKHIIDGQKANPAGGAVDLERALNICSSNAVTLSQEDKKILGEFKKSHLSYLNLGSHGNIIPTFERVESAKGCIDLFIKRNI